MTRLTLRVIFEWDQEKAYANLRKHGISFQEATHVFGDPLSTTFADSDHSEGEARFLTIGVFGKGVLLVIAHTDRGDAVRIINARPATRKERKFYEKENE